MSVSDGQGQGGSRAGCAFDVVGPVRSARTAVRGRRVVVVESRDRSPRADGGPAVLIRRWTIRRRRTNA